MARPTRFQYPGAIYHVMARGDGSSRAAKFSAVSGTLGDLPQMSNTPALSSTGVVSRAECLSCAGRLPIAHVAFRPVPRR